MTENASIDKWLDRLAVVSIIAMAWGVLWVASHYP